MSAVSEKLTDEECALAAILMDTSGLDLAEFAWQNHEEKDNCWRARPYQWHWWRCDDPLQIDQCSRSVGKSLSVKVRGFAFPFLHPGAEMVITAPELVHLEPIVNLIETQFDQCRLGREMLPRNRSAVTHRPFMMNFVNGARIIGRIPQRDGRGVKGCMTAGSLVLTERGLLPIEGVLKGDRVWSHKNRWSEVAEVQSFEDECFKVTGQGAFPLTVSSDHRFLCREDVSTIPGKSKRTLAPPKWEWIDELAAKASDGSRINQFWTGTTALPESPVPPLDWRKCQRLNTDSPWFWWFVGIYLADGSSVRGRIDISQHPSDHWALEMCFKELGVAQYRILQRSDSSADSVRVYNMALRDWLVEHFGSRAEGKLMPAFVFGLPLACREALFYGYGFGDGCLFPHGNQLRFSSSSASKALTLGMGQLATTLGLSVGYSVIQPKQTSVMGVALKNPAQLSYRLHATESTCGVRDERYVSYKIKSVVPAGVRTVYNVISTDESYWADGIFQHNTHPLWLEMDEACFAAGTLVLAKEGLLPIEDVRVGTEVFTHRGRWRQVTNTFNYSRPTVSVTGRGCSSLETTSNHHFWAKDQSGGEAEWLPAHSLEGSFWSSPAVFPSDSAPSCSPHDATSGRAFGLHLAEGDEEVPTWVLSMPDDYRLAVLGGLLHAQRRCLSTTSHKLAISARLLGLSLGYEVSEHSNPESEGGPSYEVTFATKGYGVFDDNKIFTKVNRVSAAQDLAVVYDLEVEEDHSFMANGIVVHNSDYPKAGWKEIIETLKRGTPGAVWRAHGVTRGVRDPFYEYSVHGQDDPTLRYVSHSSDPEDGRWTVHRIVAMARPDWTAAERREKELQYGSREDPDYRRNVLGAHGDAQNPIFVMHRLMKVVDDDPSSDYNVDEYWNFNIKDSELLRSGASLVDLMAFPSAHDKYRNRGNPIWVGMDVGYTQDPSEIVIFAEFPLDADQRREMKVRDKAIPEEGSSRLKCIGRVTLRRISEPDQAEAMISIIEHYKPKVFAMDSTGNGLPLFQQVQRRMNDAADILRSTRAREAAESIKGYNFSSNVLVDFDETVILSANADIEEQVKESGIKRNVLEYSTDVLRTYVDDGRLWLPWDREMIGEMSGQTYSNTRATMDRYGRRRIFSQGTFHCLVAGTMILTRRGEVPIEAVSTDDEVMTRDGWCRVTDQWLARKDAELFRVCTVGGRTLTGTSDHLVWTSQGWTKMEHLRAGDEVLTWQPVSTSSGTAWSGEGIRNRSDGMTGSISSRLTAPGGGCTERSMKQATGRFLLACTFTTSTETPSTMRSSILKRLTRHGISSTTHGLLMTARRLLSGLTTLLLFVRGPLNGTDRQRVECGIRNMLKQKGTSSMNALASHVAVNILRRCAGPSTVLRLANSGFTPMTPRKERCDNADGAEKTTAPSSCLKSAIAQDFVETVERLSTKGDVYDITVEGSHEFFAGDILVHNCLDAMRMAALGHKQYSIEALLKAPTPETPPVADVFMTFG